MAKSSLPDELVIEIAYPQASMEDVFKAIEGSDRFHIQIKKGKPGLLYLILIYRKMGRRLEVELHNQRLKLKTDKNYHDIITDLLSVIKRIDSDAHFIRPSTV